MSNPTPTPRQALRFLAFLLAVVATVAIFIMLALGLPPAAPVLDVEAADEELVDEDETPPPADEEKPAGKEMKVSKKQAKNPRWKPAAGELNALYARLQAGETLTAVAEAAPLSPTALSARLKKAGFDMAFVTARRGGGQVAPPIERPKPSSNGHVSVPHPTPEPVPEPAATAVAVAEPAAALQPAGDVARQLDAVRELLSLADAGRVRVSGKMQIVLNVEIDLS